MILASLLLAAAMAGQPKPEPKAEPKLKVNITFRAARGSFSYDKRLVGREYYFTATSLFKHNAELNAKAKVPPVWAKVAKPKAGLILFNDEESREAFVQRISASAVDKGQEQEILWEVAVITYTDGAENLYYVLLDVKPVSADGS